MLTTTNYLFSQKILFDTLTVDSTTKIIGRYPQYDKNRTFEKYNFIIEDSATILQFRMLSCMENNRQNQPV